MTSSNVGVNRVEQRAWTGREDRSATLARHRRSDEHRTMQVLHAFIIQSPRPLGRQRRLGRRVVDDDCVRCQSRSQRRNHLVDDGIVLQHEMDAGRVAHGVGRRVGNACTERFERTCLVCGSIPNCHVVATLHRGFGQRAAQETGPKKCDVGHARKLRRARSTTAASSMAALAPKRHRASWHHRSRCGDGSRSGPRGIRDAPRGGAAIRRSAPSSSR